LSTRLAFLAGIAWSSIFGFSFLVTKSALVAFTPFELLALRFTLAALALLALALAGIIKPSYKGKPKGILAMVCLFQPVIYFTCETFGIKGTASSTAGLILGALPAAVAALSVPMLNERLSARRTAGLILSVAGVALVALAGGGNGGADSPVGVLLVTGALVSAAFYNIFSRRASRFYGPEEITLAMMVSGAVFFGAVALAQDIGKTGPSLLARATPAAWGAIAYLGLLSSVVAFFLVNLSLARLKASQASVFGVLTTVVSLAAGALLRGESVGPLKVAGALAIVAGLWATNAQGKKDSA
jgi:drug/metabolite transporter (DMT)-like permease